MLNYFNEEIYENEDLDIQDLPTEITENELRKIFIDCKIK